MLIAVSGSQGSGKGTCINALVDRYGYHVVERKTSRSILEEMGVTLNDVNEDADLLVRFQEEIISRKLADDAAMKELSLKTGIPALTERCFTDLAAYLVRALSANNKYSDYVDDYVERCAKLDALYDHIFYVEAGHFLPENDGVRGFNRHYSRMMDLLMRDMVLKSSGPNTTLVDSSDVNDRVNKMYSQIQKMVVGE